MLPDPFAKKIADTVSAIAKRVRVLEVKETPKQKDATIPTLDEISPDADTGDWGIDLFTPEILPVDWVPQQSDVVITALVPESVPIASPTFDLVVDGSGFYSGSVVYWNGLPKTTTFVSPAQISASIPDSDVLVPTVASVKVYNAAPTDMYSNSVEFGVYSDGLYFNGTDAKVEFGHDVGLKNLCWGSSSLEKYTLEGWWKFYPDDLDGLDHEDHLFFGKSYPKFGWALHCSGSYVSPGPGQGEIWFSASTYPTWSPGYHEWIINNLVMYEYAIRADFWNIWHHVAITSDHKIWIDGISVYSPVIYSGTTVVHPGVPGDDGSDELNDIFMAHDLVNTPETYQKMNTGWVRISNVIRYSANFTPNDRLIPPSIDASTLAQWNVDEGSGVVLDNAQGDAARDGAITNGVWS